MSRADVDVLRGLTQYHSNPSAVELSADIELCPGAHVYGVSLCATVIDAETLADWDPNVPLATLRLQDSEMRSYLGCCAVDFDLPGLKWPSSARLVITPGARAVITLAYGHCA